MSARVAGVNIPENKRVLISLTYVHGIGKTSSKKILEKVNIDPSKRVKDLTEPEIAKIREVISSDYIVEGELKKQVLTNIKIKMDLRSYQGLRHIKKLPVRGQRTHTNARTRKGKAVAIAGKKK